MQLQQQVATELVAKSRIAAAPREWASLGMPKHNPPEKSVHSPGRSGPPLNTLFWSPLSSHPKRHFDRFSRYCCGANF